MRKYLLAILLSTMAVTSYAQVPPDGLKPKPEDKPTKVWENKSKNSSGVIVKAKVGESESKMVKVETSSPSELVVDPSVKLVELTVDYKGRALWLIYNEGVSSRSGLLDGVNTCILNVSDMNGKTIRIAVIGVVNGEAALLTEYLVVVGNKPIPPPDKPPVVDPIVDPVIPPPVVVDPPTPVVNELAEKLQDAADLDISAKKITTNAISSLQAIYANGAKQPKTTVVALYKWLSDQYQTEPYKSALTDNAKNLRLAINAVLQDKVTPFYTKSELTDADWASVKQTLASLSSALGSVKISTGITGTLTAVFVSDKNNITMDEAAVRASNDVRKWLSDNKLRSEFLFLENKYVKDKMGSIITKYGTPVTMIINEKGEYKAFKMPTNDADMIKTLKEKTGK